ncbi:hypothetical protein [Rummeliibacillus pycnus]|uniref:hypothetical protein n=1 Tax=Rummeliibacillus pycnus TaxID=101070 RepID=UPI0037C5E6DD
MTSERELQKMLENEIIKIVNKENEKLQKEIDSLKQRVVALEKKDDKRTKFI